MKSPRKQTNLKKAAQFELRGLDHGQPDMAGTISDAVERYHVKRHDLRMRTQSRDGFQEPPC